MPFAGFSDGMRIAPIAAPKRRLRVLGFALAAAIVSVLLAAPSASADVTTVSVDTLRTGWDGNEPSLAPSAVSASDFGQLFTANVDGQVYGQPIVAGGTLVAATENNKVYGLDPATGAQRWSVNLGSAWPAAAVSCGDLTPNIGVTSTPVYDPATGAIYVSAKVNDGPDVDHPHLYLHALDAATGVERAGFPTMIGGSPTNNPTNVFNAKTAMQRPGLLLLDGVVYLAYGGHCDTTPYVGYVAGVNSSTGTQTTLWSAAAKASDEAGIWQSGGGLVSDGPGRIIFATGNGVAPAPGPGDTPPATLGESVVRLGVNGDGSLTARSFFSPHDNTLLNQDDTDLGAGGPMALPPSFGTASHPRLVVQVGKDGGVRLLDADHLGGAAQGPGGGDAVLGMSGPFNGVWGHPAFWGGAGGYVYTVENNGPLRALKYSANGDAPSLTSVATSAGTFGYTSGSPVVTSTGTDPGSALVWVQYSTGPGGGGAQLRAYDAVPQNGQLSLRYSAPIGTAAKFAVPATDAGRVFVGTRDGHVLGFGRPTTAVLTTTPFDFGSVAVGATGQGTVSVTSSRDQTVTAVSTAGPFGVTAAGLPRHLAQGETLSLPVTFTPTTWGAATASLSFTTDAGTAALDLHGLGTQPGLGADPSSLSFGAVRTGAAKQLGVSIVNTGTQPVTITGAAAPAGPFTATGLPATGTVLPASGSVVVPVSYTPLTGTPSGTAQTSQLVVTSDAGSVTVNLTGTALQGQAVLTLNPGALNFGGVDVGSSVTRSFDVTNSGTIPLTITKAKAPAGAFTTATPLAEGQVIPPGDTIHQDVTFTPADAYPGTAQYEVTGNDGNGAQSVQLFGNTDPIGAYYATLGGSRSSYLSDPTSGEYPTAGGGMAQDFRGGAIYWSPQTGAHAVHAGPILDRYKALGGPASTLGYPTTDEHPVFFFFVGNDFQHGHINFYWVLSLFFLDPVIVTPG